MALIVIGAIGIYNIRDFPGLTLFATLGLLAGIFMIGKSTKAFWGNLPIIQAKLVAS